MCYDHKVIGYFGYVTKQEVICDGDSCIIVGSADKLKSYFSQIKPDIKTRLTIVKTRLRDIKRGLSLGGAYSFDEEAYNRFYPLASSIGIKIGPEDFSGQTPTGLHFVRVQKIPISTN